ncbi:hypothetical protein EXE30_03530 [Acinetobacter halotolerans]|uniref:Uncharacterized protein n=1 Tax=Acinetobacter halotolerans TaxID=1752076 RepID=A0A4Q6XC00_9GAMM|nr:hypothetical protein EXE30_03530 [Acinetobacter halotolerans]
MADIELNANIKSIQLGCGGVNGPGICDIDLSDVRITGTQPGRSGTYVDSDAKLSNPFIQFAIRNPDQAATREIVGFSLGTQSADLLMSIGQNPDPSTPGQIGGNPNGATGINTISGNFQGLVKNLRNPMVINAALGLIPLATGNAYVQETSTQPNLSTTLRTQESGINVETGAYYQFISGQRMTGVDLGPINLIVPNLYAASLLNLGSLTAKATYTPFNFIDLHNMYVKPNPTAGLSLSLNSQPTLWPQIGTKGEYTFPTTAQELDNNGNVITRGYNSNGNPITTEDLMAQRGWWLSVPQATIGDDSDFVTTSTAHVDAAVALIGLALGNITVGPVNSGQIPVQNCYGELKFC